MNKDNGRNGLDGRITFNEQRISSDEYSSFMGNRLFFVELEKMDKMDGVDRI